jgi:hypothetical protein
MKKTILYLFTMLLLTGMILNACDDPYDNQFIAEPTVNEQEPFQEINLVISVKSGVSPIKITQEQVASDSIAFLTITSLPSLADTSAYMQYELQISSEPDFSTYQVFRYSLNNNDFKVSAADLNEFLLAQNKEEVERDFYVRVNAYIISGGTKVLKNADAVFTIKATPYVKPLKPFTENTPKPYYIIGLADGNWNNSIDGVGVSIYPLNVIEGDYYTVEGTGTFTFTGYFLASRGFKLIRDIGSWDEQWGMRDGVYVHNDGGSSDIKVPADGYYTITLDSENNTLSIEPSDVSPTDYSEKGIGLIGEFTGWGTDIILSPSEDSNNHIWYTTYTFTNETMGKFREVDNWSINWGASFFPMGIGRQDGDNIPIAAGTYTIVFNDISGNYYFISK